MTLPEGLSEATYRDFHAQLVADTKAGTWTILDFWDSLPWLQGPGDWTPWRAFVAAVFGLPMTEPELALYRRCTRRQSPPTRQVKEAWMPVGRRARKSATAAVIAAFVGAYWNHSSYTAPGQRAVIPVLAKSKGDAQTIKQFVDAIFKTPALTWMVDRSVDELVQLSTGVDIQIKAATIMAGRSPAIPLAILDEIAFFKTDDAANPDTEIIRGIRPAMATVDHPLLLALSSPYARKGELWTNFKEYHGKEDPKVLVWQADTLTMHPGDERVALHVADEYAKDPVSAAAEYGAKFRTDVETFITDDIVEAVTDVGVAVRPPIPGVQYVAFADPSGGTSDSYTLAIGHWESESSIVLDLLHETRPTEEGPFKPAKATEEQCHILARYGIKAVEGDRYAGEWPREAFDKGFCQHEDECTLNAFGLCEQRYSVAYTVSEYPKRDIYKEALHLFTDKQARLIDSPRLRKQLTDLERRTSASGDIIDHPPGGHDDLANAAAGVLCRASRLKLRPRKVVEPPKTLVEQRQRNIHEKLKKRIAQAQRDKERSPAGGGGWV